MVISNHNSFRVLFDEIASVYILFEKYVSISASEMASPKRTSTVPVVSCVNCHQSRLGPWVCCWNKSNWNLRRPIRRGPFYMSQGNESFRRDICVLKYMAYSARVSYSVGGREAMLPVAADIQQFKNWGPIYKMYHDILTIILRQCRSCDWLSTDV